MAKAILCDRCGRVKSGDVSESFYGDVAHRDLDIVVLGETIASFGDLCDDCSDTLISGILNLVGTDSINLTISDAEPVEDEADEIDPELEYVGTIEDFGVDIIETEDGIEFGGDE